MSKLLNYCFVISLLFMSNAFAGSLVFPGGYHVDGVTSVTPNGANWTVAGTSQPPVVVNPTPPPPPPSGACVQGQAADVAGYKASCSGVYKLHSGGADFQIGPSQYTFPFVFAADWPGSRFGSSDIFVVGQKQYISIPFKPASAHTISLNENQTYTGYPITFSVSTSQGLFNNGQVGNGVVCVATNNPTLKLSSNGNPTAGCKLDPTKTYWFNAITAKYGTSGWYTQCTTTFCQFAVTIYSVN